MLDGKAYLPAELESFQEEEVKSEVDFLRQIEYRDKRLEQSPT